MVKESPVAGESIFVEKRNHCVIYPASGSMVAESVERRNKNWWSISAFYLCLSDTRLSFYPL